MPEVREVSVDAFVYEQCGPGVDVAKEFCTGSTVLELGYYYNRTGDEEVYKTDMAVPRKWRTGNTTNIR